ncbi:MAG: hypothetical protein JST75_15050 [Bacteroidetes bacterium]|nr:hypothetical protein [Bacteroidota bacterium]
MKTLLIILLLTVSVNLLAQTTEQQSVDEEQAEHLAEKTDVVIEDDSQQQRLAEWLKNPIELNKASEEDLVSLGLLTDLQIKNFFRYRALLGKLISVYELQAIPSWNLETIRLILSYIKVMDNESIRDIFEKRWKAGSHYLLFRAAQSLEKPRGFNKNADSSASVYLGSPQRILFRYTYNYKNLFQYGIVGDKDAGEQFFKGYQRYGFDFYSIHFFVTRIGKIKALALGDFTINMGQGLIQWQSLAFTKSSSVLSVKRQSPVLRPYHSPGEFNFHRGAGITLYKDRWETTVFISNKKIGANLNVDTANRQDAISSFDNSGYHRTKNENEDKNNIGQLATGFNINFSDRSWHLGLNGIYYHFSNPIHKEDQPYNLFAITGKSWMNSSIDYSYTFRNFHFFGEAAIDKNFNKAFVNGVLMSLAAKVDAAIIYRNIDRRYQSMYADAFTENTVPNNEKGLYAGISVRPFAGWRVDAFFDIYNFSWLKFRVDGPSSGKDFFVKFFYQPDKKWYIYTYFKNESKNSNVSGLNFATHQLAVAQKQNWRTEVSININNNVSLKTRIDCLWYNRNAPEPEKGFLAFESISFKPAKKIYGVNVGLQYFETGGYNSRLFVSEPDVLYSYTLSAFYSKGFRYHLRLDAKINRLFHFPATGKYQLRCWLRWAQTIYPGKILTGNGPDQINDSKRSELKIQLILAW